MLRMPPRLSTNAISSGNRVRNIQKPELSGWTSEYRKSIPPSAGRTGLSMRPIARCSGVSASSTVNVEVSRPETSRTWAVSKGRMLAYSLVGVASGPELHAIAANKATRATFRGALQDVFMVSRARHVPQRHCPRAELQPAHELQVEAPREPGEQRRPMARDPGMYHELVLVDQSQLRQRQRERHASHEQSLARLSLELLDGLPQIPAHELRVPVDPVERARYDVLLRRVDCPGEGFRPVGHHHRPCRQSPRRLHHFVGHPAEDEAVGPGEVLDRVTMQLFVSDPHAMIAAPVQGDVDGIPKGSHSVGYRPVK